MLWIKNHSHCGSNFVAILIKGIWEVDTEFGEYSVGYNLAVIVVVAVFVEEGSHAGTKELGIEEFFVFRSVKEIWVTGGLV